MIGVAICTPVKDHFTPGYVMGLWSTTHMASSKDYSVTFFPCVGTILPNERTQLVKRALDGNWTHVLFIDSDMAFPSDTIDLLLEEDRPIVAVECAQRGTGNSNVRRNQLGDVSHVGMGVMMIQAEVFRKLPEPWFAIPYDGERFVGEDIFFCQKAREYGYEINLCEGLRDAIYHEGLYGWQVNDEELAPKSSL